MQRTLLLAALGFRLANDLIAASVAPDTNSLLFQAARDGNLPDVQRACADGSDVNAIDPTRGTALMIASYRGHTEIVRFLLGKGADVNARIPLNGATPLWAAAQEGRTGVVALLLDKQADLNVRSTTDGTTALFHAAGNGHVEVVKLLLGRRADPNVSRTTDGATALMRAVSEGHIEIVRLLVRNEADVNAKNTIVGSTALITAAYLGYTNIVKLLLTDGKANTAAKTQTGITALDLARERGHPGIVEILSHTSSTGNALPIEPIEVTSGYVLNPAGVMTMLNGKWVTESDKVDGIMSLTLEQGSKKEVYPFKITGINRQQGMEAYVCTPGSNLFVILPLRSGRSPAFPAITKSEATACDGADRTPLDDTVDAARAWQIWVAKTDRTIRALLYDVKRGDTNTAIRAIDLLEKLIHPDIDTALENVSGNSDAIISARATKALRERGRHPHSTKPTEDFGFNVLVQPDGMVKVTPRTNTAAPRSFTDARHGISLKCPEGWVFLTPPEVQAKLSGGMQATSNTLVFCVNSTDPDQNVQVRYAGDATNYAPDDEAARKYLSASARLLLRAFSDTNQISWSVRDFAGGVASELDYPTTRGETRMRQRQVYFIARGKAFILLCLAREALFDQAAKGAFATILESIDVQ